MTTPAAGAPGSPVAAPDQVAARDAVIGWYRGEFAAANAVIDALCGHLAQIGGADYDAVFAALHRRRLNWFPVLHMQKFYSVADVAAELRRVSDARAAAAAAFSEEEAASTVIHEPMDELVVTVAAEPDPEPEHEHEPIPEAQPDVSVHPVVAVHSVDADREPEADGEDSSGDSSERKAASTEDDAAHDGR
ncbi:unnamed protein product [Triticum turgidum subsp. durum]|uniref:Uncharacterized protein n=1 Tax=Triticum turgidum subsp. durum TaxID=4567 RepID=A0A9R0QZC8_TRITD|nr:unnamed protein product [Triticum turgidum subsp. durum]